MSVSETAIALYGQFCKAELFHICSTELGCNLDLGDKDGLNFTGNYFAGELFIFCILSFVSCVLYLDFIGNNSVKGAGEPFVVAQRFVPPGNT